MITSKGSSLMVGGEIVLVTPHLFINLSKYISV